MPGDRAILRQLAATVMPPRPPLEQHEAGVGFAPEPSFLVTGSAERPLGRGGEGHVWRVERAGTAGITSRLRCGGKGGAVTPACIPRTKAILSRARNSAATTEQGTIGRQRSRTRQAIALETGKNPDRVPESL